MGLARAIVLLMLVMSATTWYLIFTKSLRNALSQRASRRSASPFSINVLRHDDYHRVRLIDADAAHRVTLLGSSGGANSIDGSTWNPFTRRLLFTSEGTGGVFDATPDYPSTVGKVDALGYGGYEGVQVDGDGNLWLVSDIGGRTGTVNTKAKQPNSFIYRFSPTNVGDLSRGGVLEALQVTGRDGKPITFTTGADAGAAADADILSAAMRDLHTYGLSFRTGWVKVHDTATDGTATFDANAAAKAAGATPFKRPENGVFRPGTGFREFAFTETGDTNAATQAGEQYGGFGGVFLLSQRSPSAAGGRLRLVVRGDVAHTGFDNIAWWDRDRIAVVEDAGDGLHTSRNALDSGYLVDVRQAQPAPVRFLAEGRDPSATIDSALSGTPGFQNEGDNEITGIHVSDGDPTVQGLLGRRVPRPFEGRWRVFWTAQHGDNVTYEIVRTHRGADR